jgi:L-serine dehydratase
MPISVLDLFTIGIGPSSSHTVGPMRAARLFVRRLSEKGLLPATGRVQTHFYGSLALTGRGHGSDKAVLLGLEGESPEEVDVDAIAARLECLRGNNRLLLDKKKEIVFMEKEDILFHPRETMPEHPNGMLVAFLALLGIVWHSKA